MQVKGAISTKGEGRGVPNSTSYANVVDTSVSTLNLTITQNCLYIINNCLCRSEIRKVDKDVIC